MNFKNQIECYQAIAAALSNAAPRGWIEIKADIALDGVRVDAVVSCTEASGRSGHLTGIPMLARYFYELARLISTEKKGLFKQCAFTLNSSGKYGAQFTY